MKLIFLYILFELASSSFAQVNNSDSYSLGLTTGYSYTKSHFIQIGAIYGTNYGNAHIGSKGIGVGADIGKVNNNLTVGTKAFIEYNYFIVTGFRLNIINYYSGSSTDFRLMPQIGFSGFGYFNLMYGYSIPTLGNELKDISRHSFSLTINIISNK